MSQEGLDEIPEELAKRAFRHGEEMAWKQEDCADVIEWLRNAGFAVLGMELWVPDGGMIRTAIRTKTVPAIYCTACDPLKNERWDDYVERSARSTMDSIASFHWFEDFVEPPRPVYFNITWANRRWFREQKLDKFAED